MLLRSKPATPVADGRMSLTAHLLELRRRVFLAAVGLTVGAVGGWALYEPTFAWLQAPITSLVDDGKGLVTLNFSGVASSLDMKVKVSLFIGVILASPWWNYQLWAFVNPGLTRRERRRALAFVAAAVPLFLAGAFLASRVLPQAVALLTEFTPDGAANVIDAQQYISFVMQVMLAFGVAFLLPVFMVALNAAGVVPGRTWAAGWRWAVVAAFAFAAVMSPTPDVLTMFAMALPICALYAAAVGICLVHDRRVARRLQRSPTGER